MLCLDPPDLSHCLHEIQPAKYDSVLMVACFAPGNPKPDLKCELWGENNVLLHSEGECFYLLQSSVYRLLMMNLVNFSQVHLPLSFKIFKQKKQKCFCKLMWKCKP